MFNDFIPFSLHDYFKHGITSHLPTDGSTCAIILNNGVVVAKVVWDLNNKVFNSNEGSYYYDNVDKFYQYG